MTLTQDDYKNIHYFLTKCRLEGTESITHAILLQKTAAMVIPTPEDSEEEPKEEPKKENKK